MTTHEQRTRSLQAPPPIAGQRDFVVTCTLDQLHPILDDFTDRLALFESAQILYYGQTGKASDGFLLIRFTSPDGLTKFLEHLRTSEDILDYVLYDPSIYDPAPVA